MFNKAVFKQSLKSNYILFIAITLVLSLLLIQFSAIGALSEMLGVIYYGMMTFIIPTIYILIVTNKLMSQSVDSGSMAYTLSCPVKRRDIVFTQALFLIGSIISMFTLTTIINLGTNQIETSYKAHEIVFMNMTSCASVLALCGIYYMVSCIFNLSKKTLGVNGVISAVFILSSLLATMSGNMLGSSGIKGLKIFKYTTIFSLSNTNSILSSTSTWIWQMGILLIMSAVSFVAGGIVFKKKDLPL